jgi:hypothetical protein
MHRWNVQQPDDSWTHVFLPFYPTFGEIATALGREPKEVISITRHSDEVREVQFDDFDVYTLNRVW